MKYSPRSTAALGALAALCLATPAAEAARPADHQPLPPQANQHATPGTHGPQAGDGQQPVAQNDAPADAQTQPADPCTNPTPAPVFAAWYDASNYVPVPNGGFEQGDTGWTLADGAAVVEGNDPFFLGGAADHQSLALPAGSSATSPGACFTMHSPTFRLVGRTSGDRHAQLKVEVLYTDQNGRPTSRTAGKIRGGDSWRPSKRLSLAIGRAKGHGKLLSSTVAFRFTPLGSGDWQIDDLYLDPRARH
jgi:hypothetical protein